MTPPKGFVGYTYKVPRFYKGQRVRFTTHRGQTQEGEIYHVETHYSQANPRHTAYHVYSIRIDGYKINLLMGERAIIGAIP